MREIIYVPVKARCADGVMRTARVRATIYGGLHPDNAFSVPASVQAHGKTVRGYVCPADGLAWTQDHEPEVAFHATTYHRNHAVIKCTAKQGATS